MVILVSNAKAAYYPGEVDYDVRRGETKSDVLYRLGDPVNIDKGGLLDRLSREELWDYGNEYYVLFKNNRVFYRGYLKKAAWVPLAKVLFFPLALFFLIPGVQFIMMPAAIFCFLGFFMWRGWMRLFSIYFFGGTVVLTIIFYGNYY